MDEGREPERIVIRAPQPGEEPGGRAPDERSSASETSRIASGTKADIPMAVAVLGGVIICFAPLLPWWSERIGDIQLLSRIVGVTTWPGILCELAGGVLVCTCAYMVSKPEAELGTVVMSAGAVASVASILALVAGGSLLSSETQLDPEVGLYLTVAGAVIGTVGGYMLMRKDSR